MSYFSQIRIHLIIIYNKLADPPGIARSNLGEKEKKERKKKFCSSPYFGDKKWKTSDIVIWIFMFAIFSDL